MNSQQNTYCTDGNKKVYKFVDEMLHFSVDILHMKNSKQKQNVRLLMKKTPIYFSVKTCVNLMWHLMYKNMKTAQIKLSYIPAQMFQLKRPNSSKYFMHLCSDISAERARQRWDKMHRWKFWRARIGCEFSRSIGCTRCLGLCGCQMLQCSWRRSGQKKDCEKVWLINLV